MLFCVLNSPLFPCPRTHMLHVRKLGEGFVQRGYHYKEITRVREVGYLSRCDVLYVSNHFTCDPLHRAVAGFLSNFLLPHLQQCKARLILWNFHTVPVDSKLCRGLATLLSPVVHLGEDTTEQTIEAEPVLYRFRKTFPVLRLLYSSPLHPAFAKLEQIERCFDFNFVGHGYKKDLTDHCVRKYRAFVRNTPPTISEPLRVNSFRRSEVNLVFHADANVRKGIIVERFAEALSWGGIIFHDHPLITKMYPDCTSLFYVTSAGEIDESFARIRQCSAIERQEMRQCSLDVWKRSGRSYFEQAGNILAAFQ